MVVKVLADAVAKTIRSMLTTGIKYLNKTKMQNTKKKQNTSNKPVHAIYTITYRNSRPRDMNYTFQKEYSYRGMLQDIILQVKYHMGKYGGLKAELTGGDIDEITNREN